MPPSAERDDPAWLLSFYPTSTSLLPVLADTGRHKGGVMSLELPTKPNLEYLRKQAKDLLQQSREGDAGLHGALPRLCEVSVACDP